MTADEVEAVARAIYMTHWKQSTVGGYPPTWEAASDSVKAFVQKQAISAIKALEARQQPELLKRPGR